MVLSLKAWESRTPPINKCLHSLHEILSMKTDKKKILLLIISTLVLFSIMPKSVLHKNYVINKLDLVECMSMYTKNIIADEEYVDKNNLYKYQLIDYLINLSFEENKTKTVNIHLGTHFNIKNPLLLVSNNNKSFNDLINRICKKL